MDSNLQSTFGSVDMSNSFTAYTDTMLNLHKVSRQAMTKLIHQSTITILNFPEKKLDLPDLDGGDEQTRDVGRGHEPEGGEGDVRMSLCSSTPMSASPPSHGGSA